MIMAIDRGNGLTELIVEGEDENKSVYKTYEQDPCNLHDVAADKLHRHKGAVKGVYCGRDGVVTVFDRLLCSGRKGKK